MTQEIHLLLFIIHVQSVRLPCKYMDDENVCIVYL